MGANAQTAVPAFTAGQVLTAAQMTQVNTGIPVFADTTARDAAFGGTGEKVLAEGQYAFLESTNQTLVYDGAAWQSVGASALVRVGGGALSGAATTFTNVFSATYAAYDIVITNLISSSAGVDVRLKMGATATGYYASGLANAPGSSTTVYLGGANTVSWEVTIGDTTNANGTRIHLSNPFLAANTVQESSRINPTTSGNMGRQQGILPNNTSYTDCTISVGTGTFTGTVNIYGYALS
jgi:hypothetical protein